MVNQRNSNSIHQLFIEIIEIESLSKRSITYLGRNSDLITNQYELRSEYKFNSLIICTYAEK